MVRKVREDARLGVGANRPDRSVVVPASNAWRDRTHRTPLRGTGRPRPSSARWPIRLRRCPTDASPAVVVAVRPVVLGTPPCARPRRCVATRASRSLHASTRTEWPTRSTSDIRGNPYINTDLSPAVRPHQIVAAVVATFCVHLDDLDQTRAEAPAHRDTRHSAPAREVPIQARPRDRSAEARPGNDLGIHMLERLTTLCG